MEPTPDSSKDSGTTGSAPSSGTSGSAGPTGVGAAPTVSGLNPQQQQTREGLYRIPVIGNLAGPVYDVVAGLFRGNGRNNDDNKQANGQPQPSNNVQVPAELRGAADSIVRGMPAAASVQPQVANTGPVAAPVAAMTPPADCPPGTVPLAAVRAAGSLSSCVSPVIADQAASTLFNLTPSPAPGAARPQPAAAAGTGR